MKYHGFLSYNWDAEHKLPIAASIQGSLQRFARPWYKRRALRIFRDAANLGAAGALPRQICSALDCSTFLILIACPESAHSGYVNDEARYWCERHHDIDKLLIVLAGGGIERLESDHRVLDWDRTTALPRSLRPFLASHPHYVDLRWVESCAQLSLDNPTFRDSIAMLGARLHGRDKIELLGEDLRQHRKRRKFWFLAAVLFLLLAVSTGALAKMVLEEKRRADKEAKNALETSAALVQALLDTAGINVVSGSNEKALAVYERAVDILTFLRDRDPTAAEYQFMLASTLRQIGVLHAETRDLDKALAKYEDATAILEHLVQNDLNPKYQRSLAAIHNDMGIAYCWNKDFERALAAHETALTIRESLLPTDPTCREDVAQSYENIGNTHLDNSGYLLLEARTEELRQALAAFEKALPIGQALVLEYPAANNYQEGLGKLQYNIGLVLSRLERDEEAITAYTEAIRWLRPLEREQATNKRYWSHLARCYNAVAYLHVKRKEHAKAVDRYEQALPILERLTRLDRTVKQHQTDLGRTRKWLPISLAHSGDHAKATTKADTFFGAASDGETLMIHARVYALSSTAAIRDILLTPEMRTKLSEGYGTKAVEILQRAKKTGHFERPEAAADLNTSPDFDSLRGRDDFSTLLKRLSD